MENPTDPSLNFLSSLKGTREKVKTKLAREARRQHARRQRQATFSRRQEIGSDQSILIDFPQDSVIKLELYKFLIDYIDSEG